MTILYLSNEEIQSINEVVVALSGGSAGLRDAGLLESIAMKPQTSFGGIDMYPDIHLKAAVLFEALVNYHVFIDGNKRTAFAAMGRFLAINHYELLVSNKEIVDVAVKVATKKLDLAEIATWIKQHSNEVAS